LTELTAKQIALSCAKFGGPHIAKGATDDVILRGGISNNRFARRCMCVCVCRCFPTCLHK
jgi:hypothetical protein